ncbi:MAG: hypothetical protein ACRETW_06045 [Stenotrophobium sp.]
MTARARLQSQIKKVQKRVRTETAKRKKQIAALRVKAADAALHWVMSHQNRVDAFRSSVKGTPVAKALDALLVAIKDNAGRKAATRAAPKRKSAAKRKPAAKKSAKKRAA